MYGDLSNAGEARRRFIQTFVLVAQNQRSYYLHNDIFRFLDKAETPSGPTSPLTTSVPTLVADQLADGAPQQQQMKSDAGKQMAGSVSSSADASSDDEKEKEKEKEKGGSAVTFKTITNSMMQQGDPVAGDHPGFTQPSFSSYTMQAKGAGGEGRESPSKEMTPPGVPSNRERTVSSGSATAARGRSGLPLDAEPSVVPKSQPGESQDLKTRPDLSNGLGAHAQTGPPMPPRVPAGRPDASFGAAYAGPPPNGRPPMTAIPPSHGISSQQQLF